MFGFHYGLLHGVSAAAITAHLGGGATPALEVTWLAGAGDATNQSIYTFAAHALGTTSATRKILVGVSSWGNVAASAPTGVTVDGQTAVLMRGFTTGQYNGYVSCWIADVPSNTTGDIVVTHDGTQNRCAIGAWRLDPGASAIYVHNHAFFDTTGATSFRGEGYLLVHLNTLLNLNFRTRSLDHEFTATTVDYAFNADTYSGLTINQDALVEGGGGIGADYRGIALALGTEKPFYVPNNGRMNAANLSTYTFTNVAFASPDASRKVVVGIHAQGAAITPTGVTIGGVAASQLGSTVNLNSNSISFWVADVPSGWEGSVVVSLPSSRSRCGMFCWSFYNSVALSVTDSASDSVQATVNIDIPANGVCLAISGSLVSNTWRFAAADQLVIAGEVNRVVGYSSGGWSGLNSRINNSYGETGSGSSYCTAFISLACL